MITNVTALADPAAFDFDRTALLNGSHTHRMEYAILDAARDSVTIARQRCVGCWTPRTMADQFCGECGANFSHPTYQLLMTHFPPNPITRRLRGESSTEKAKMMRKLFWLLGITGLSVTKGRGTASRYISVTVPHDKHWVSRTDGPLDQYGYHDTRACPRCTISTLAQKKAEALILAAFPDLDNRSDSMTDYFDFVFTVNTR